MILLGDVREIAATLEAESFDGCLCDPPYGLSFMGKKWDYDVPSVETWEAVLGALKPGAHLLAFAGTRTQHRMAVRIEDAGFEIRDMIAWVYGSGFPKSLDVSKAIDRQLGEQRPVSGRGEAVDRTAFDFGGATGKAKNGLRNEYVVDDEARTDAARNWQGYGTALKPALEPITVARKPLRGTVAANVLEFGTGAINVDGCRIKGGEEDENSLLAWNSSMDSRVLAESNLDFESYPSLLRVPSPRDVHDQLLCGLERSDRRGRSGEPSAQRRYAKSGVVSIAATPGPRGGDLRGRWPANLIHDGSEEVLAEFPEQASGANPTRRGSDKFRATYGDFAGQSECVAHRGADSGSAARFFYCAKASRSEREAGLEGGGEYEHSGPRGHSLNGDGSPRPRPRTNHHPTVKPIALAEYLARLILPPKRDTPRRLLVPFSGSGSEIIGALRAGWDEVVGIELSPEYAEIAEARIAYWLDGAQRGIEFDFEAEAGA